MGRPFARRLKKKAGGFGRELEAVGAAAFIGEGGFDMKAYEAAVRRAAMAEGRRFLEGFLNDALPKMLGIERVPGSKGARRRRVMTSMGEVALLRAYTPGRPCPMDEAIGLAEGCTAEAASMMCFASAMSESYGKGEAVMRKLAGVEVSGRTMQRLVNAVSPRMEAAGADQAHEAFPRATAVVNTELDMTGVPVRPEDLAGTKGRDGDPRKKQIKVGVSFRQERDGDGRLGVVRSSIAHIVAYEDADAFGDRLYGWQARRGLADGCPHVVTADGAPWIWEQVSRVFPGAVQIVDMYHANEHLMALCRLLHPEKDGAKAAEVFETRRRMLKAHGAGCVIRYFEEHARGHPDEAGIMAGLNYFRTNIDRMQYGRFRKRGYVVGSGAVEGSCRSLVNQRADLSGQRWHPQGALNILRIRGMIIDGIHEEYWRARGMVRHRPA